MPRVLLIGNNRFTTSVVAQVRGLDVLEFTVTPDVSEAAGLIDDTELDLVIAQACQVVDIAVFRTLTQARHRLYFLVVEDRCLEEPVAEKSMQSHQLTELSAPACYGLSQLERTDESAQQPAETVQSHQLEALKLERTAIALEAGADAYLWLRPINLAMLSSSLEQVPAQATQPVGEHDPERISEQKQAVAPQSIAEVGTDLESPASEPFIQFHQSQCRLIQAHIHLGLSRAERYRDLSRTNDWLSTAALIDSLTQLNNRRAFDAELPKQIENACAKQTPLSMMVFDIDRFKQVNDRYGHLVGDDMLKNLAKRLSANMRFYDKPFRYGGEEFVVTLSNTDLAAATAIAERLRQSIEQQPFALAHLGPGATEDNQLHLTISIGLSELRAEDDAQGRSFLHRADQNLLQAKSAGRNQVVSDWQAQS